MNEQCDVLLGSTMINCMWFFCLMGGGACIASLAINGYLGI